MGTFSGDFLIRKIEVLGKRVKIQIWDTSGLERFRPLTTTYHRHALGIFLVYDVAHEGSFNGTSGEILSPLSNHYILANELGYSITLASVCRSACPWKGDQNSHRQQIRLE
jgi:GTPase SAR1 family protein